MLLAVYHCLMLILSVSGRHWEDRTFSQIFNWFEWIVHCNQKSEQVLIVIMDHPVFMIFRKSNVRTLLIRAARVHSHYRNSLKGIYWCSGCTNFYNDVCFSPLGLTWKMKNDKHVNLIPRVEHPQVVMKSLCLRSCGIVVRMQEFSKSAYKQIWQELLHLLGFILRTFKNWYLGNPRPMVSQNWQRHNFNDSQNLG